MIITIIPIRRCVHSCTWNWCQGSRVHKGFNCGEARQDVREAFCWSLGRTRRRCFLLRNQQAQPGAIFVRYLSSTCCMECHGIIHSTVWWPASMWDYWWDIRNLQTTPCIDMVLLRTCRFSERRQLQPITEARGELVVCTSALSLGEWGILLK